MIGNYGLQVLDPATDEPLSLAEVKAHLRILEPDADNSLISGYLSAAREYVEEVTGRQIMAAQYRLMLDAFPGRRIDEYRPPGWRYGIVRLPRAPLATVDAVRYIDTDGALQTLATTEYQWDAAWEPGLLAPARFKVWPIADPWSMSPVRIDFTCGYADAASVPERIKQAIRLLTSHLYELREPVLTGITAAAVPAGLQSFIVSCGYGEVE